MSYKFELPWPPSINGYWATFRNRRIISKKGRQYKKDVYQAVKDKNLLDEKLGGDLVVSIILNPPTLRRYDVDNYVKCIFDSLGEAGFWVDDSQVVRLVVEKGVKTKGGNALVTVLQR